MEIVPTQPTVKAPAETFSGDAWYDVIAAGQEPSRIRVNVVRFAPGARNAWHSHARGQTLHVTDGIGRIQSRGGAVAEIRPGDTIHTPPGEWHWHGAAPGHFMTHLACGKDQAQARVPKPSVVTSSPMPNITIRPQNDHHWGGAAMTAWTNDEFTRVRREGHIQAGGVGRDVTLADADHNLDDDIDAAYRSNYRRYAGSITDSITSPGARSTATRLLPR